MRAVLVFCEGHHDVVFAQRSLGTHAGCEWVGTPIGKLPTPFGRNSVARKGFIGGLLERHPTEDRPVRAAAHPPPPGFESIVENTAMRTMFFMIRAQGKTQCEPVVHLLQGVQQRVGAAEGNHYGHGTVQPPRRSHVDRHRTKRDSGRGIRRRADKCGTN